MSEHAVLEVCLHRRDTHAYGIELRYQPPADEGEVRLAVAWPAVAALEPEALEALGAEEYGQALGAQLFSHAEGRMLVKKAQAVDLHPPCPSNELARSFPSCADKIGIRCSEANCMWRWGF